MKKFLYIILVSFFSLTIISCAEKEESTVTVTFTGTTTLSDPSGLTATGGASQVALDWTAVSGAISYTVYWDNSTGVSSSSTAITSVSTDNYTHSSLDNGTTYYYKVAAVYSAGTGSLSGEVNATTTFSTSSVVTMDNLTIGSQTYTNAFKSSASCTVSTLTDKSGDYVSYATVFTYYDNKSLIMDQRLFNDSSCTNSYTATSVVTSGGALSNPLSTSSFADNITVVQLSNYLDNGTALPVFDNSSNAVDNGSMYGLIANRNNATYPLMMVGQIYPISDNEVHAAFGYWLSCRQNAYVPCTTPDNFTNIQDNVGSFLYLSKYNVMK
jgi:hypothetical protein